MRANLEVAAKRGTPKARAHARAELDGPPYPHALRYLHSWAMDLHRARRYGRGGGEPVTWVDLQAWAQMTGRTPEPHEVEALLTLTHAMAHPPDKARS